VWINNNTVEVKFLTTKEGASIPESEQRLEKANAKVLIPWRYIKGILVIDDDRTIVSEAKKIGF